MISVTPHPCHTYIHALANITCVDARVAPGDDIAAYLKVSVEYGISGVEHPYWEVWGAADPSIVITPDVLHVWHKLYFDHVRKWVINIIGGPELD